MVRGPSAGSTGSRAGVNSGGVTMARPLPSVLMPLMAMLAN